ncbi:hypothetical protein [Tahibacter harae]|uniref:Uncharacterized protein n=1 Tax=Tahibacter harae TaxID=2963937 RepID=A0ABT1QV52_9GAMM|nr:hypothetical protein [Tahibacter harae]MCQ4166169.1 hypothetical protein [Tahibacter harae]
MIWFDLMPERRLADDEIHRALADMIGCAYHEVGVINDIADLRDLPATCLVVRQSCGDYGQQLSIYLNDSVGAQVRTASIVDAAAYLARIFGTDVLISDDKTANPYRMLRISGDGRQENVAVDSQVFDEQGVIRIIG